MHSIDEYCGEYRVLSLSRGNGTGTHISMYKKEHSNARKKKRNEGESILEWWSSNFWVSGPLFTL